MYQSVIFDVDGTLWDSTSAVTKAWRSAAKNAGAPYAHITEQRLKEEFGKTMEAIAISLFDMLPFEEACRVMERCCDEEVTYLLEHPMPVFPQVPELFARLVDARIPIYVVSNCQAGYIEAMLKTNRLEDAVTAHLCPGDSGLEKDGNIRLILDRYNPPAPCYVGDTRGDETASEKAGVPFVFASYGFGEAEAPAAVIESPLSLLPLVGIR